MNETRNRYRDMLRFEDQWSSKPGQKSMEVRARFGLTLASYYDEMIHVSKENWAAAEYPMVVSWLRRLELERSRTRNPNRQ